MRCRPNRLRRRTKAPQSFWSKKGLRYYTDTTREEARSQLQVITRTNTSSSEHQVRPRRSVIDGRPIACPEGGRVLFLSTARRNLSQAQYQKEAQPTGHSIKSLGAQSPTFNIPLELQGELAMALCVYYDKINALQFFFPLALPFFNNWYLYITVDNKKQ